MKQYAFVDIGNWKIIDFLWCSAEFWLWDLFTDKPDDISEEKYKEILCEWLSKRLWYTENRFKIFDVSLNNWYIVYIPLLK